jgi:hypothetical protein
MSPQALLTGSLLVERLVCDVHVDVADGAVLEGTDSERQPGCETDRDRALAFERACPA